MPSVLIVDDAADYCAEIATGLTRDGHSVSIATNPRDAIDLGCMLRPDVLITDWMLRNYIDGLSVSEVIRILSPQTQTILITGFASEDLRLDAARGEVFDFIEKPFHLSQIREAARNASKTHRLHHSQAKIGALLVDKRNAITFANQLARETFHRAGLPSDLKLLHEVFGPDDLTRALTESDRAWVELTTLGPKEHTLLTRCRRLPKQEQTLWVFVDDSNAICRQSSVVYRLLGFQEPSLEISGHVLVIDDDESVRHMTSGILRDLNCLCHAAQTHEEAIRLFVRDAEIRFVVVDYEMPDGDPRELVNTLSRLRPDVRIVGTSGGAYSEQFSKMGVPHFLPKPWNLEMLIDSLTV